MATLLPGPARFLNGRISTWDVANGKLTVATEAGSKEVGYDWCVHALGSHVGTSTPGVAERAHKLDDPATAAKAAASLRPNARVLVVGAGLTGIETATEI